MCIPKRTGVEQARHDTAMRAINRGRRNHPRHHNNLVLPALTVAGCAVCLIIVAVAMWGAATIHRPPVASTTDSSTTIEVVP